MNICLHIGSVVYTFNSLLNARTESKTTFFESIFLFIVVVLDLLTGKNVQDF